MLTGSFLIITNRDFAFSPWYLLVTSNLRIDTHAGISISPGAYVAGLYRLTWWPITFEVWFGSQQTKRIVFWTDPKIMHVHNERTNLIGRILRGKWQSSPRETTTRVDCLSRDWLECCGFELRIKQSFFIIILVLSYDRRAILYMMLHFDKTLIRCTCKLHTSHGVRQHRSGFFWWGKCFIP